MYGDVRAGQHPSHGHFRLVGQTVPIGHTQAGRNPHGKVHKTLRAAHAHPRATHFSYARHGLYGPDHALLRFG